MGSVRVYFVAAPDVDQDVNCDVTEGSHAPIVQRGMANASISLARLGDVDLGRHQRRREQSRHASASNNSGLSHSLLIRVRCRSALGRPVPPTHRRPRLGSLGEEGR